MRVPDSGEERATAQADEAPARPRFISGLPQREEVPTPRTVGMVRKAVLASILAFVVPTALAALDQADIRASLRTELAERAPDYSDSDIGRALAVTLIALGVMGALLSLFEFSASRALQRRGSGGRTALIVLTIIHLPLLLVIHAFRGGGTLDLIMTALQAALLVTAAGAAAAGVTKRWLRAKPPLAVRTLFNSDDSPAG